MRKFGSGSIIKLVFDYCFNSIITLICFCFSKHTQRDCALTFGIIFVHFGIRNQCFYFLLLTSVEKRKFELIQKQKENHRERNSSNARTSKK